MKNAFCSGLSALYGARPFLFLTGDLGFAALEPLQAAMGARFINAGIAEQNMVSVAAGAAQVGWQSWAYSIAPFIYGRPFEQVRNDVCLHDLDVKLVGAGGGFAYGVMGATHHALEDYGVLCALPNMRVHVPAFADDVAPILHRMAADPHPAYLRLGRCEKPADACLPDYAPWRRLLPGQCGVMVVVGPIAGGLLAFAAGLDAAARPEIWVASEMPFRAGAVPDALLAQIAETPALFVVEEHVEHGGAGQMLAMLLLNAGIQVRHFGHFCARGYQSGRYGSQAFHRAENGLEPAGVIAAIRLAMSHPT
jgi:transketolase